jgi:hypothetical protein
MTATTLASRIREEEKEVASLPRGEATARRALVERKQRRRWMTAIRAWTPADLRCGSVRRGGRSSGAPGSRVSDTCDGEDEEGPGKNFTNGEEVVAREIKSGAERD